MEASANVEAESVSLTDKESDKVIDVAETKTSVDETSFEIIDSVDDISDTDKCVDKDITTESVSTSKDIISLDSNVSFDTSEKIVDNSASNNEETEVGQTVDNEAEPSISVNADEENLLDEIHSGEFNATSSPIGNSDGHLNTSTASVDDSFDLLENEPAECDDEQDIEEEEDKDQTIVLDDDDDDEDDEDVDNDTEDDDEEDSDNDDDESLDDSDKDENNAYGQKDDDISTLSSDGEDVETIAKEPEEEKKPKMARRNVKRNTVYYKKLIQKSIKMWVYSCWLFFFIVPISFM